MINAKNTQPPANWLFTKCDKDEWPEKDHAVAKAYDW